MSQKLCFINPIMLYALFIFSFICYSNSSLESNVTPVAWAPSLEKHDSGPLTQRVVRYRKRLGFLVVSPLDPRI